MTRSRDCGRPGPAPGHDGGQIPDTGLDDVVPLCDLSKKDVI